MRMQWGLLLCVVGCMPMSKAIVIGQRETTGYGAVQYIAPIQDSGLSTGIWSAAVGDDDICRLMAGRAAMADNKDYGCVFLVGFESNAKDDYVALDVELDAVRFHKQLAVQAGIRLMTYMGNGDVHNEWHGNVGVGLNF